MNVLFVTYDFPYPTTSGGKNRAYHLLKHTSKKANVFLYSFVREDYDPASKEEILKLGVKKIFTTNRRKVKSLATLPSLFKKSSVFKFLYFDDKVVEEMEEIIKNEKIGIVHYESTYTGYYIDKLKQANVRHVLGTENIEFLLYKEYASRMRTLSLKPVVVVQANMLKNEELSMVRSADKVTVITRDEVNILKDLTGVKSEIVANGIEPGEYSYSFDKKIKKNILFVGNFTYFPNVDAVNFFYENIFHQLREDVTITIVGKKCKEKFKFEDERIIKKDFVEDIISEYRNADILIFPIRIGGGTNFKVLEAMSLGVPVVAQPERLAGLGAVDGVHFLKAGSANEYADKIDLLYSDAKLREKLARNARKLIEDNFDWDHIGKDLLRVWESVL